MTSEKKHDAAGYPAKPRFTETNASAQRAFGTVGPPGGTVLVAATGNAGKLAEIRAVLAPFRCTIVSLRDAGVAALPEETGATFADNAYLKAAAVAQATGYPALADDSGLCVDALGGAPGVYSARYGAPGWTDTARMLYLLEQMRGVPDSARTAYFEAAVCLCRPDGHALTATGRCDGTILAAPDGDNGFGYDPVFCCETGASFGRMTEAEKNAVSHRGRALRLLAEKWKENGGFI